MKDYKIPFYDLGEVSLEHAFSIVFGEETLIETHGDSLKTSPWQDYKRTSDFYIHIDGVLWALRHFIKSGLHVTVHQTLNQSNETWKVSNQIQMHFIGSRFFKISSEFELILRDNNVFLTGNLQCNAKLLPPLNSIAEKFMIKKSKHELDIYTEIITKKFNSNV